MKILIFFTTILFTLLNYNFSLSKNLNPLYEKIDLFGEVLEKIEKDYVDEVDQAELMVAFSHLIHIQHI